MNPKNFILTGKNVAANYIIERLYLNRPQLIFERRENKIMQDEAELRRNIMGIIKAVGDSELTDRTITILNKLADLHIIRRTLRPYKLIEIRKPALKSK